MDWAIERRDVVASASHDLGTHGDLGVFDGDDLSSKAQLETHEAGEGTRGSFGTGDETAAQFPIRLVALGANGDHGLSLEDDGVVGPNRLFRIFGVRPASVILVIAGDDVADDKLFLLQAEGEFLVTRCRRGGRNGNLVLGEKCRHLGSSDLFGLGHGASVEEGSGRLLLRGLPARHRASSRMQALPSPFGGSGVRLS